MSRAYTFINPATGKLDYEGFLDAAAAKANDNWNPRHGRMVALDDTLDYQEALKKARQEQAMPLRSVPAAMDRSAASDDDRRGDAGQPQQPA